ncbi:sugar ABC transporter permease [Sporosarcina sp. Marseille-Q4063]|uniref:carbohydrate ABC transporter permease n=1 Tax=Sporosarcina sp. Marseille-Q4063 TaxID=2810514 RepID=UPI001BB09CE6|nr:sugar ABC transporter permease [Sporosarcina sp. Marseille-Q4063]QUW21525.1 sugar ABC transporter permease [Sporosarcina sp. Marseille-Q4063]
MKKNKGAYLLISPFFLIFAIFGVFPILFSIYLALSSWDGIGTMEFVGLKNFKFLVSDTLFWKSIGNTFIIWFLSTVPMIILALIVAFLLNSAFLKFSGFYKTLYFLPNVTAIVAVAIVFSVIFAPNYGLINYMLNLIGFEAVDWHNNSIGVKVAISAMIIWRWTGYNAIIFLAGLQKISGDLYEAARIDGANSFEIFTKITIPLLKPVILFVVITSTIGGMQTFVEPQLLVGNSGGAGGGGLTIVLYLYQQAFVKNLFGYGSAIAIGLFIIIMLFSLINWKFIQRKD